MSGTTDEIKGRVKEAAGVLTGNERLKNEGRLDQAVGKVKKVVERVIDKAKGNRKPFVTKAFFGPARISNRLKDAGVSHCDILAPVFDGSRHKRFASEAAYRSASGRRSGTPAFNSRV
jgi:uncharacterized protein YjbJ (UPF0337 family)